MRVRRLASVERQHVRKRDRRQRRGVEITTTDRQRRARGYELQGTVSQHNLSQRIIVVADSSKALDITASFGEAADQLILLPTGDYVRGNRDYWLLSLGPRAVVLADRWIRVPVARAHALEALGALSPATVARCLVEDHGTLRIVGDGTVEGQRAILIRDDGNVPGSQPGVLAVAASALHIRSS